MNTYNITFSRIFEETRQLTADNKEEAKSKLKRDLDQESFVEYVYGLELISIKEQN